MTRDEQLRRFRQILENGGTVGIHPSTFGELLDSLGRVHGLPVVVDVAIPRDTIVGIRAGLVERAIEWYRTHRPEPAETFAFPWRLEL
jgi:hypothetical protein